MFVLLPFGYLPFEHHLISPVIKMSTDTAQKFHVHPFIFHLWFWLCRSVNRKNSKVSLLSPQENKQLNPFYVIITKRLSILLIMYVSEEIVFFSDWRAVMLFIMLIHPKKVNFSCLLIKKQASCIICSNT